jgi:hypothetical protein
VRTGFPDGTALAVDAVPVVDGVARVDLDPQVRLADEDTRRAFSAQLIWTLGQVPGVRFLDLNAGGQVLDVAGASNPQPMDAWPGFDPNAMPEGAGPLGIVGGRVIDLNRTPPLPVPGQPAARRARDLSHRAHRRPRRRCRPVAGIPRARFDPH